MNIQIIRKAVIKSFEVSECEAYVESETNEGTFYKVTFDVEWHCTCPNSKFRDTECKHIVEVHKKLHEDN